MKLFLSLLALLVAAGTFAVRPASADEVIVIDHHAPQYQTWQANWDRFEYDRHHVILGTVAKFEPFRLEVARRDGAIQMIDLKNGTVILPTGTTPMLNERVAIVGYYSRGTFIANRVIIRT
jgi:hypothetical protein